MNKHGITNGRTFGDIHEELTCHIYTGCRVVDFFLIVPEHIHDDILNVYVSDCLP